MKRTMHTLATVLLGLALCLPALAADEPPDADKGAVDTSSLRLLLNSFASLGEGHVERVLAGLKIIAVTEEAQSGDWEKMKGQLAEFQRSGIKAASVWFLRPDGSSSTVEKGPAGLDLRDRAYFPALMAGSDVTGYLDLNTSTGKRTAIVAVPVRKNGKVVGALGASLAVDEISAMIDEKMGLPQNIIFYALDQKGQTSLHRTSALLFGYPSDMGSRSLAKTVERMLAEPEGAVSYDFYGSRTVLFRRSRLTGWVYALGVVTGKPGQTVAALPPILSELEKRITEELGSMDRDAAGVARRFSEGTLTPGEKRKLLTGLCRSHSYAVDCSFVDRSGRMELVEPREYAKFEGSDISGQEQVVRLQKTKQPVLSSSFRAVEGFEAVDLEHPVLSAKGELEGSVSILYRPDDFLTSVMTPVLRGMPVEAWAMQKDGRILFEEDKEEVGRMLFDDPLYKPFPQLLVLGSLISRERTGAGSYDFLQRGMQKQVKKDAHWTTVGLHGTEWRVVVMHVRTTAGGPPGTGAARMDRQACDDALRALAGSAELKQALSGKDHTKVRETFRNFYDAHGGLYSIQWLDRGGTNRYGYPEENSLVGVDMKTAKTESAKPMLRSLAGKNEADFDAPLVEGKTGRFFMVPVFRGEDYLGMLYTITVRE